MFNVALIHPQIPNNTGAIGRLCVNAGATLHVIRPIGFDISEKAVRRAGLDYWEKLNLHVWENLEQFLKESGVNSTNVHLATTKTDTPYFNAKFNEGDFILFGSETAGLPKSIHTHFKNRELTIPMTQEGRSLNLAISCGIVLYDAIRQTYKGSL